MSTSKKRCMKFRPCIDLHDGFVKQVIFYILKFLILLTLKLSFLHIYKLFAHMY